MNTELVQTDVGSEVAVVVEKLAQLKPYMDRHLPLFPVDLDLPSESKSLLLKDATSDKEVIARWVAESPECGWAIPMGKASGLVAVLVSDLAKLGDYDLPWTLQTTTAEGGEVHIYRKPKGDLPKGELPRHMKLLGDGDFVLVAPTPGVKWIDDFEDNFDNYLEELPEYVFTAPEAQTEIVQTWTKPRDEEVHPKVHLNGTQPMALEIGEVSGELSEEDISNLPVFDVEGILSQAPNSPNANDYMEAMRSAGWNFRLNELNHDIFLNDLSVNDIVKSVIRNRLNVFGYKSRNVTDDAINEIAARNSFHPVKEYLDSLEWDGQDHIGELAGYFTDKRGVFDTWLKRWLVGAIARVYAEPHRAVQNRMLILDGPQNIGKSYFVRWLASDVPLLHIEDEINPNDKDCVLRLGSKWIWEVGELGSTVRKADREALKHFITKETVTVRRPYARVDIEYRPITSFIGTINNEGGFFTDPTGNRRYMTTTLVSVDWSYSREVSVGQVWAQAKHLFDSGEPWDLNKEEIELANEVNKDYEVEDILETWLFDMFDVDPREKTWFTTTSEIVETIESEHHISGSDRQKTMRVSEILVKAKCDNERRRVDGKLQRGWLGIRPADAEMPF